MPFARTRRLLRRSAAEATPLPAAETGWRLVPARWVVLAQPVHPDDTELHVLVLLSALSNRPDPVHHVTVHRRAGQVEVTVWVLERAAARNESITLIALACEQTVQLGEPLGEAEVVGPSTGPLPVWESAAS